MQMQVRRLILAVLAGVGFTAIVTLPVEMLAGLLLVPGGIQDHCF